jgi:hypothetical protein
MNEDKRFYGLYQGICVDIEDPDKESRIKLLVPQVLGQETTEWARPCLPVLANTNHPDHKYHLASEVAALLNAHGDHAVSVSGTSGPATVSTFGSHTHSFSATQTLAHTNNHTGKSDTTNYLDHEHKTVADEDNKWNDDQETDTVPEHTPHRLVPKLDQKVWVMFEGGDPNFPVWMGVEL